VWWDVEDRDNPVSEARRVVPSGFFFGADAATQISVLFMHTKIFRTPHSLVFTNITHSESHTLHDNI
jgi:hypothetical protein